MEKTGKNKTRSGNTDQNNPIHTESAGNGLYVCSPMAEQTSLHSVQRTGTQSSSTGIKVQLYQMSIIHNRVQTCAVLPHFSNCSVPHLLLHFNSEAYYIPLFVNVHRLSPLLLLTVNILSTADEEQTLHWNITAQIVHTAHENKPNALSITCIYRDGIQAIVHVKLLACLQIFI